MSALCYTFSFILFISFETIQAAPFGCNYDTLNNIKALNEQVRIPSDVQNCKYFAKMSTVSMEMNENLHKPAKSIEEIVGGYHCNASRVAQNESVYLNLENTYNEPVYQLPDLISTLNNSMKEILKCFDWKTNTMSDIKRYFETKQEILHWLKELRGLSYTGEKQEFLANNLPQILTNITYMDKFAEKDCDKAENQLTICIHFSEKAYDFTLSRAEDYITWLWQWLSIARKTQEYNGTFFRVMRMAKRKLKMLAKVDGSQIMDPNPSRFYKDTCKRLVYELKIIKSYMKE